MIIDPTRGGLIVGNRNLTVGVGDGVFGGGLAVGNVSTAPESSSVFNVTDLRSFSASTWTGASISETASPSASSLNILGEQLVARDEVNNQIGLSSITGLNVRAQEQGGVTGGGNITTPQLTGISVSVTKHKFICNGNKRLWNTDSCAYSNGNN